MNLLNLVRAKTALLVALVLGLLFGAPAAMASTPTVDFSGILDGLDTGTMVTAILAACAIIALVGFAKWGGKKLARFFG